MTAAAAAVWDDCLSDLRAYQEAHGHCAVPASLGPLGAWVGAQRRERAKRDREEPSGMTAERERLLDGVGFIWDAKGWRWRQRLRQLRAFRERNVHCDVPTGGRTRKRGRRRTEEEEGAGGENAAEQGDEGVLGGRDRCTDDDHDEWGLSRWVGTQRTQYRFKYQGLPSHLTDEREAALNELGFRWDVQGLAWSSRYERLCRFKERHGHCNAPTVKEAGHDVFDGLGAWVGTQRTEYRYKRRGEHSHLTDEREGMLRELGFDFSPRTGVGSLAEGEKLGRCGTYYGKSESTI